MKSLKVAKTNPTNQLEISQEFTFKNPIPLFQVERLAKSLNKPANARVVTPNEKRKSSIQQKPRIL